MPAWGAWSAAASVASSETSGSQTVSGSTATGVYTRYRISVTDTLDAISAYVTSNTVRKNSLPPVPAVLAPKNGGRTYNIQPRFLIQTGVEADGELQTVWVFGTSQTRHNSMDNPNLFSRSGQLDNSEKTVFANSAASPAAFTAGIKVLDTNSESALVLRSFTLLPSPFEDISANRTHVKAAHMQALRTAVNNVCGYYGMEAYLWSGEITAGITQVRDWVYHIQEIRAAVERIADFLNVFDSSFDFPQIDWIPLGTGRPRADVMNQLRDLVLML